MATPAEGGFIERHVEKIVLGVCALILLYVVFGWVIQSPRTTDVRVVNESGRAEEVVATPETVDELVAESARNMENWAEAYNPPAPPQIAWAQWLDNLAKDPLSDAVVQLHLLGPSGRPAIEMRAPKAAEQIELASLQEALPPLPQPKVTISRELPNRPGAEDETVGRVLTVLPVAEIQQRWAQMLRSTVIPPEVYAYRVDVQVQHKGANGQWSDPRAVESVALTAQDSEGRPLPLPTIVPFRGDNEAQVRESVDRVAAVQEDILQPEYWELWWPPLLEWVDWRFNLPENVMSTELVEQLIAEGEDPWKNITRTRRISRPGSRGRRDRPRPDETDPMYDEDFYRDMMGEMDGPSGPPRRRPTRRSRPQRTEPTEEVIEIETPKVKPIPGFREQLDRGSVLVWAHDASLEMGKSYRYRMRVQLVNPALGYPREVKRPADARKPTLATPWTDWSEPIRVGHPTRFFVTGMDASNRKAKVTVFTSALGQWVEQVFMVVEGEPIGASAKVKVINPVTREIEQRTISFETGATVVSLDFGKKVERPGIGAKNTLELLLVDGRGELESRVLEYERDSEEFRELQSKAEQARNALADQAVSIAD